MNVVKIVFVLLLAGRFLGGSAALAAPAPGGDLPMPDLVVVREGAVLPPGCPGPEIPCLIVEEGATALRLDISRFRGIQQVVSILRADVVRMQRGDASLRPWYELGKWLQWPRHSREPGFYELPLKKLDAFLKQYPDSTRAAEAAVERKRWQGELEKVKAGNFRILDHWFKAVELGETDRKAWEFRAALPGEEAPAVLENWETLVAGLAAHHGSRFYPALLEDVRRLAAVRRTQFAKSFHNPKVKWNVLEEPTGPLWDAWEALSKLEQASPDPLAGREAFLGVLERARLLWKDLEWIDDMLDAALVRVRARVEQHVRDGKQSDASELLESWQRAPGIFPPGSTHRKDWEAWFVAQKADQNALRELALLEKALADKDWVSVEKRVKIMLEKTGGASTPIRERVTEVRRLLLEWKAAEAAVELQRLVDGKQYGAVLVLAREKRLKMEGTGGVWEVLQQQQADMLVDVAQQALGEYRFWTAWRLVLEAWRTKPGNLKAQLAITLGAAGGFLLLLLLGLPLLLIYAWLSKSIEQIFFHRRLRVTRLEEEHHIRRQREAASKIEPPPAEPPE